MFSIPGSELRSDQLRFSQLFADLRREPVFKLRDFESAVDRIRDSVAERLWKLLVEDSGLVAHLQVTGLHFWQALTWCLWYICILIPYEWMCALLVIPTHTCTCTYSVTNVIQMLYLLCRLSRISFYWDEENCSWHSSILLICSSSLHPHPPPVMVL